MIDREARNRVCTLIRRFLAEELTAFQFDEALDDLRDSPDSAVHFVVQAVWFHYDDCDDHLVTLNKYQWDYFQRLLLLLESNSTVEISSHREWSATQLVAAVLLAVTLFLIMQFGWLTPSLLPLWLLLGLISMGLDQLRRRENNSPYHLAITPFDSMGDLELAYRSAGFKKQRYPQALSTRRIRSVVMESCFWLEFMALCMLAAPLVLFWQSLPARTHETKVIPA
jgi:hypothetical protein